MIDEEVAATAVLAALTELQAKPFDLDDLPSPRPKSYTEITVTRMYTPLLRDSLPGVVRFRITTRVVGSTVTAARQLRQRVSGLEGLVLLIAAEKTTPIAFETAEQVLPDEGWFSGLSTWTFGI